AYAHVIHATPASLAADLEHLGNYAAATAAIYPPSATRTYWEDRAAFWASLARSSRAAGLPGCVGPQTPGGRSLGWPADSALSSASKCAACGELAIAQRADL